jgi:Protein of unknown function (DUF3027)
MTPDPQQAEAKTKTKPRAGVPVWRTGKPDAVLAAAVDTARTAVEGIAKASEIGRHIAARSEGDRLVTHLFESKLPGYVGWQWYAVLTRNARSKVITVNELGLLPSEDSILAPEWVPWAERVRPDDVQEVLQEAGAEEAPAPAPEEDPAAEAAGAAVADDAGAPVTDDTSVADDAGTPASDGEAD